MGGATATVADAQFLVANDPALIPTTPGQARSCLTYFRAILMVAFTFYHPWPMALGSLLLDYAAREVQLEALQVRDPRYRNLAHALIVRYVQLHFSRWIQMQWNSPVPIPVPDLSAIFEKIDLEQMWEPTLPTQYLNLAPPLAPPPAPTPAAPPAARLPPAARVPPPAPPAPAGPRSHTQMDNPDYLVGDFGSFGQIPIRVRDLLDRLPNNPPPVSSHDAPHLRDTRHPDQPLRVCLSYHIKGHCNINCGRKADHKPLTATKRQELLAWCTEHYHAL